MAGEKRVSETPKIVTAEDMPGKGQAKKAAKVVESRKEANRRAAEAAANVFKRQKNQSAPGGSY